VEATGFAPSQPDARIAVEVRSIWQTFKPELDVAKQFGLKILRPLLALAQKFPLHRPALRSRQAREESWPARESICVFKAALTSVGIARR
jgi:hypothetical protein